MGTRFLGFGIRNHLQRYKYYNNAHILQTFNTGRINFPKLMSYCVAVRSPLKSSMLKPDNKYKQEKIQTLKSSSTAFHKANKRWRQRLYEGTIFLNFLERVDDLPHDAVMADAEWGDLEKQILDETPALSKALDYSLMKACSSRGKVELAKSLMDYIKKRRTPNMSVSAQYLSVCSEKYPDLVISEFEEVSKNNETVYLYDLSIVKLIVYGLSKTKEWKKCIEILEECIRIHGETISKGYHRMVGDILEAAVRNADFDTYFTFHQKYVDEAMSNTEFLPSMFFNLWEKGNITTDVLLELLKTENMYLSEKQIMQIEDSYKRKGKQEVSCKFVDIWRENGLCKVCGDCLQGNYITPSQFATLADNFYNRVIIGKTVYLNTTPEELKTFMEFLKKKGPFDYVVDGLNVMHDSTHNDVIQLSPWKKLLSITSQLYQKGKRILIIKRQTGVKGVETKWKSAVEKIATAYNIERSSSDDLFMLLAAFHSGPETYFVTNDNLRDHIASLDPDLKSVFNKWQRYRQIVFDKNVVHGNFKKYDVKIPSCYDCMTHESDRAWHVPYVLDEILKPYKTHEKNYKFMKPATHLCIRKIDVAPSEQLQKFRQVQRQFNRKDDKNS